MQRYSIHSKTQKTTTTGKTLKKNLSKLCLFYPSDQQKILNPSNQYKTCNLNWHIQNIPQLNICKTNTPSHQPFPISLLATHKLFSRSRSVNRIGSSPSSSMHQRTHSESNEHRQPLLGMILCAETTPSPTTNHQIKTILKPLSSIKTINGKNICNPYWFRGAPIGTTFVRMASNRTRELWHFLQEASHADLRVAELEHPSLIKMSSFCSGRVPIYVHPSFYRALKLKYPKDVGEISRDGRVTTELGTGYLRHPGGFPARSRHWVK